MALKKTITTVQGLLAPDAYHRIDEVRLESRTRMSIIVRSYADGGAGRAAFADTLLTGIAYDIDGQNPFRQAYSHLKGLIDYAGAEDV